MPVLRGIEVKLVTIPTQRTIPEYPHPDGTSVRLITKQEAASAFAEGLSAATSSPTKSGPAVPNRKVDPKSSVYIATQPGCQFVISYDIKQVPEDCRYMNFKIFINGRHIVTCGRDLKEGLSGAISQTLWAPSDLFEPWAGIEGRQFVFLRDETAKTAAEDGGLIEVRAHRAAARVLLAPELRDFKQSRQYGIATPSAGLVSSPEQVDYYKYKLIDPLDSPYANFFFHYRSLESLKDLNLIPEDQINEARLAPPLPKPVAGKETFPPLTDRPWEKDIGKIPKEFLAKGLPNLPGLQPSLFWKCSDSKLIDSKASGSNGGDSNGSGSKLSDSKTGDSEVSNSKASSRSRSVSPHEGSWLWLDGASDDRPVARSSSQSSRAERRQITSVADFDARDEAEHRRGRNATAPVPAGQRIAPPVSLQRPLPDLPLDPRGRTRRPSKSPVPSLTPSLKTSVENGDFDDDIEIAEAKIVRYSNVSGKPTLIEVSPPQKSPATRDPSSSSAAPSSLSDISYWSDPQAGYPTALTARPQPSYTQRRTREQNQQVATTHPVERVPRSQDNSGPSQDRPSRQQRRPVTMGPTQAVSSPEPRRARPQSLNITASTYRGTDTTMQAQVQRSPQRQRPRPTDLQLSPEPSPTLQRPSTYSALRDLGAQMLSGATSPFRRTTFQRNTGETQMRTYRDDPGSSRSSRRLSLLSPTTRRDRDVRDSELSASSQRSSAGSSSTNRNANTTPARARADLGEQRWSSPRETASQRSERPGGLTLAEILRESPRHEPVIERMINQLNREDSFKENRPPGENGGRGGGYRG